uniref:ABC transmembrane type-1 domain-containing protein n=1 Tax=Astyanax mexicanus TaxID=7994 RepID=A0A3B1J8G4_ASTMX
MAAFSKHLSARNCCISAAVALGIYLLKQRRQYSLSYNRSKKADDVHSNNEKLEGQKEKAAVDKLFISRMHQILKVLVPQMFCKESGYLLLIALMLVSRTYCDVWMIHNGTMIERLAPPPISHSLTIPLSHCLSLSLSISLSLSLSHSHAHCLTLTLTVSLSLSRSLSHSLLLSYSLTHSLCHSFTLTILLSHSQAHSLTRSLSLSHSHSLTLTVSLSRFHSLTLTVSLSLSHSLTRSLLLSHSHAYSLTLTVSLSHSHCLSLSPSLSHSHCLTLTLSLSRCVSRPPHSHLFSLQTQKH